MSSALPPSLSKIYPFQTHSLPLQSAVQMSYVDEGSGDPIVMLHGNPTWSFFYRNLILALKPHFRCIAPDNIGCGLSSKPQNYPYSLQTHIENTNTLLRQLALGRFHLIVHDWGGAIGMGTALKFLARVKSLTILNSAAFLSQQIPARIALCRLPLVGPLLVRQFNFFARAATTMTTTKPLSKVVKQGYLFPYDSWNNRIGLWKFLTDIPLKETSPSYKTLKNIQDSLSFLSQKPIQILWGERDFCFNETFLQKWLQEFPKASVMRFPRAGHYLLEDEPEATQAQIRTFLMTQLSN